MKLYWLVLLVACQRDKPPPIDAGYARDIERICHVVERSGAASMELADRTYVTATWLSQNLETQEARRFLAELGPIAGAEKGNVLDTEAARTGVKTCPLADDWKRPR